MAILDIFSIKHHLYVILYESNEQDFAIYSNHCTLINLYILIRVSLTLSLTALEEILFAKHSSV